MSSETLPREHIWPEETGLGGALGVVLPAGGCGGRLAEGHIATFGTPLRTVPACVQTPTCAVPLLTTTKDVPGGHCVALAVHQGLTPIVKCSAPGLQGVLLLKQ